MDSLSKPEERSFKEQRVREISLAYYSRPEVRKILLEFAKNRECVPRYFEGFGKRPDFFQFEGDIMEHVRRGATSFHCSEELWSDPLEISTDLSRKEFDELRIGWDLIIDIDSPYFDYSKTYAKVLIKVLKRHNIDNIGVKFSGSKGFHIIIPWIAFPKEAFNQKTKNLFPEWPRIICNYLSDQLKRELEEEIFELYEKGESIADMAKKMGKKEEDFARVECLICHREAVKKELVKWFCDSCKNEILMIRKNKRIPKCPNESCRKPLREVSLEPIYSCEYCNIDSRKSKDMFKKIIKSVVEADLILVAPRHLFRMPYSLHEKTALASVVIDKDDIETFQLNDAKPFKVEVKSFYPNSKEGEAKELLIKALHWKEQQQRNEESLAEEYSKKSLIKPEASKDKKIKDPAGYKEIIISNPDESIFPPCIKLILKGMKADGKKRGLFILINFFKSLGLSEQEIEKRIFDWNTKNEPQLKKGYIQSQIIWYKKNNSKMLPPNCDKPHYKDIGVCRPDELCRSIKNPVNYFMKKYFRK